MGFLREVFQQNKKVVSFLLFFFGSYIFLSMVYHLYLQTSLKPDFFTRLVAVQSQKITQTLGYDTSLQTVEDAQLVRYFIEGNYVVKIIEGCNGISVMILFMAFVIAFRGKFTATILFIIAGLTVIYSFNLMRIAALAIGILEYPEYENLLHDIFFPGVIYGTVFLLWVIWVKQVSKS
ncbi:exosortase family protein XrtF [Mesonia sp. K7]|uniref:exosortase family protein XrtF n=1 Tax=Mesonia sp. K7 TaxID=2218606 RepID=UPI000DA93713|nr:exosortase family protein XrtF [Mesonia sp. K7]PZD76503.1 exosortase family protein XrtF [Mesonia sp. K7]